MGKLLSLGRVLVTAAGTPARVTANEADPSANYPVHGLLIQALTSNTGVVYVGAADMDTSTLAGVYAVLGIPGSTGAPPVFSATITQAANGINLDDLWLDVSVSGEGALISGLRA